MPPKRGTLVRFQSAGPHRVTLSDADALADFEIDGITVLSLMRETQLPDISGDAVYHPQQRSRIGASDAQFTLLAPTPRRVGPVA